MAHEGWVEEVLRFWFGELTAEDWYTGGEKLDQTIRDRFADLHARLSADFDPEVDADARTALAAIIVFDQFPRNMHRGSPAAFATDAQALSIARKLVDSELDSGMSEDERQFAYMPFMHSEVLADQERCVDLFKTLANEEGVRYAIEHRDIIADYGRFPHRNKALGRESTAAEKAFLNDHAGFGQ